MGQGQTHMLNWRSIIEGIVIGVTVATILGIYQWVDGLIKRHKQVRYIREIVAFASEEMTNASELNVSGMTFSPDIVRHTIFVEMYANMESALAMADRITFKQKAQLKLAMWGIDLTVKAFAEKGIKEINVGVQRNLFEELAKVEWLKIPSSK